MLDKEQVIEQMYHVGTLDISAQYENVQICGRAVCDAVKGAYGRVKLRAKFKHGIKAVFEIGDYGKHWQADAVIFDSGMATASGSGSTVTGSDSGMATGSDSGSTATASGSGSTVTGSDSDTGTDSQPPAAAQITIGDIIGCNTAD